MISIRRKGRISPIKSLSAAMIAGAIFLSLSFVCRAGTPDSETLRANSPHPDSTVIPGNGAVEKNGSESRGKDGFFRNKIVLPPNGIFIGSSVYPSYGGIRCGGRCFTVWNAPDAPNYDEIVKYCLKENQGNLLQFWASGGYLLKLMKESKEAGLYSIAFSSNAAKETTRKFQDLGEAYLGYDFGERFNLSLYNTLPASTRR